MAAIKFLVASYTTYIASYTFSGSSINYVTQTSVGGNPSWLGRHTNNTSIIYANNDNPFFQGKIYSFNLNPSNGALQLVDSSSTQGLSVAHFTALKDGTGIYAVNYDTSTGIYIPYTNPSTPAQLQDVSAVTNTFKGSGPNPNRQTQAHPHQVVDLGTELLVPDLGSDKIWRLVKSGNTFTVANSIPQPAGSGPRHLVVTGNTLYTLHELDNTITQHTLTSISDPNPPPLVASLSILPPGTSNPSALTAGEILIAPTLDYIYATNRNDPNSAGDAIAIFKTNPLTLVGHVRTGLKHLRGAALAGDNGKYLFVGGMNSGGVVVYERTNGGASLVERARLSNVQQPSGFLFF